MQNYVVNHVAFVFGVVETERAAKVFGSFLGDCRMPGLHVHSKSRFKACIKGTIFALEELFPSVLVAVVAPDALYVTRREFTKFTVKDGFCFFHSCSAPRKWDWADVVVVPGQSCRLVVVQLLLNIRRL